LQEERSQSELVEVTDIARRIRRDVIQMVTHSQSGHVGGALGAADLLAVLYFEHLHHDPHYPAWEQRDRFVLSNGHICAALYSALARSGYFDPAELLTFRKISSRLQGHPSRHDLPGIETSAGPLGQGLSIANGMALGLRLRASKAHVYCLVGDGEMQEGQFWEAAMTAPQQHLENITLLVSWNNIQIDGSVQQVKNIEPIGEKLTAFGWRVEVIDGHDIGQIRAALRRGDAPDGVPTAIIARTILGKGVSFMENQVVWHGKAPSPEEGRRALMELGPSVAFADLPVKLEERVN
jgi:transketolase